MTHYFLYLKTILFYYKSIFSSIKYSIDLSFKLFNQRNKALIIDIYMN